MPAASKRRGRPLKDASVRRDDQLGHEAPEFLGASLGEASAAEQSQSVGTGLQHRSERAGFVCGDSLGATRPETTGGSPPIPAETWRSFARCCYGPTGIDKHPVPGPLADSEIPQELHKGGKAATTLQKA